MSTCVIITILILTILISCDSWWYSPIVVLRSLTHQHLPQVSKLALEFPSLPFSAVLDTEEAIDAFFELKRLSYNTTFGCSSVVEETLDTAFALRPSFISTKVWNPKIFHAIRKRDYLAYPGVKSVKEMADAMGERAHCLKVYPVSELASAEGFEDIVNFARENTAQVKCFISGGITEHNLREIWRPEFEGFFISLDCNEFEKGVKKLLNILEIVEDLPK